VCTPTSSIKKYVYSGEFDKWQCIKKYSVGLKKSAKNDDFEAGRIVVFILEGSCFERCGHGSMTHFPQILGL
jgi:hypothetical protein